MVVGYIQYDVSHSKEDNFKQIQAALDKMKCDVVVLPELCLCGYLYPNQQELLKVSEAVPHGISTQKMLALSQSHCCTIVFGLAEKDDGKIYNTAVVVSKGKYIGKYRKIHLSDFEKKFFQAGNANDIFAVDGFNLGVQICFDLWFPEVSRQQVLKGADLLCVLANFGGETTYTISQTRAIENLTPLVMCNRIGSEKSQNMDAYFLGKSTIVDAGGSRLREAKADCCTFDCCTVVPSAHKGNVICKNFREEIIRHYSSFDGKMPKSN